MCTQLNAKSGVLWPTHKPVDAPPKHPQPRATPPMPATCLQDENGGAGVYSQDIRKRYLLEDDSWRHDIIPEIMDGHNVLDFVDPDIEAKLDALDREEDAQMAALAAQVGHIT